MNCPIVVVAGYATGARNKVNPKKVVVFFVFLENLFIVQALCESRGGCPGLSVLTSLLVSVDVKIY